MIILKKLVQVLYTHGRNNKIIIFFPGINVVHYVHTSGTCSRCVHHTLSVLSTCIVNFYLYSFTKSAFTVPVQVVRRRSLRNETWFHTGHFFQLDYKQVQLREQMVLRRCQQLLQPWPNRLTTPCHMLNNKVMLSKMPLSIEWLLIIDLAEVLSVECWVKCFSKSLIDTMWQKFFW